MKRIVGNMLVVASFMLAITSIASAQVVQGTGVGGTLRVTVLDPTEAALVIAQVTIVGSSGVEQTLAVNGVAMARKLSAVAFTW
jgi:hypothetical protein